MRRSRLVFAASAVLAGALLGWLVPCGAWAARSDEVQVLVVRVAPQHDTSDRLAAYVTAFDPRFVSVAGAPEVIRSVAAFGLTPGDPDAAPVMVLDQRGHLRLLFPFRISAPSLAEDLAALLRPVRW